MTRFNQIVLTSCFVVLTGVAVAGSGSSDCVIWSTEARSIGFAYHHLVHLDNQCDETMVCDVWTDVNSDVHVVTLEEGEMRSVTTYMGSPSREFKASVECEAAD